MCWQKTKSKLGIQIRFDYIKTILNLKKYFYLLINCIIKINECFRRSITILS